MRQIQLRRESNIEYLGSNDYFSKYENSTYRSNSNLLINKDSRSNSLLLTSNTSHNNSSNNILMEDNSYGINRSNSVLDSSQNDNDINDIMNERGMINFNQKSKPKGSKYVPAGQSTQMIIGATSETDYHIMSVSESLYNKFDLKRVFYSAFVNVN